MEALPGRLRWRGLHLCVAPGVLPPWYSTEAVAAVLAEDPGRAPEPRTVVDVGCGTGALGLLAARRWPGSTVTLVDVCPQAARAAAASVAANHLALARAGSTVHVLCADGLSAVAAGFRPDLVLCNLPFDAGPPPVDGPDLWGPLTGALRDPGYRTHAALFADLARRVPTGGRVLLATSPTIGDPDLLFPLLTAAGLAVGEEVTFWFSTPRRRRPAAVNAYSVLSLERNTP
jgi:SAM-dependent methyltransferase